MKRPGLRLSVRLALAFGLLLALELAAVAAGLYQLEAVNLLRLEQARWELARHQIEGWSAHTRAGVLAAVAQARAGRVTPGPAWAEAEMKSSSRQAAALRTRLAQAVTDEAGQALLAKAQAALADYESAQQPAIAAQAYLRAAASLVGHVQDRFAASQAAFEAGLRRLYIGLPAVFALATLLGVLLAWALLRSLLAPIRQSVRHAQSLAQGDLSVDLTVSRRDELGDLQGALAQTQRELRALVASVRCGTDQLAAASSQMASGNQDLSERTGRAAGSLLQTTAAVAQLNGMIRESADAADTANELAGSAASVAQRGAEVVSQVVSTMQAINDGSRRISEITSVIDDIAFQTGILALNAAVEAARAGEQGRGFAVVAAEVRSLAGRSAQAAQEIKTLIGASVRRVDDGSRLVEVAGATMHDIEQSVQRVARAITEVTMAAGGQTMSVGEMNQAVRQLDEITQQNAALVEQSAAVARSLKNQADGLGGMVAMFRLAPRAGPP